MRVLTEFSQHPAIHALGWTLLHFVWQGFLVAILLASVLGLLRGRRPQWRYVCACSALALMLLLLFVTWLHLAAAPHIVVSATPVEGRPGLSFESNLTGSMEPWPDRMARELDHSVPWVISVWCVGVVLLWSRLNIGLIVAWRMKSLAIQPAPTDLQLVFQKLSRRLGVVRAVKLVNSALVQVPTVIGWLRPVILIPVGCLVGLSASQIEALLAHELAHIRRHDYLVNVFQSVVETLLFYHPAVWWISEQIRREREHCCDDLAISMSGDPLSYAKALSFLEEHRSSVPMVALGASGRLLAARIRRLLGGKERPAISRLAATTLLVAAIVAMGLCVGPIAHSESTTSEPRATKSSKSVQVPATRASFTATGITRYYDPFDVLRMTETWILAMKPDGSSARVILSHKEHPFQFKTVVNVPAGLRVSIDLLGESVTTYEISDTEKRHLLADVSSCPTSGSGTNPTLLGYATVLDHQDLMLGSEKIDDDRWLAPSLNCLALMRSYKVIDSGKLVGQTTEEVVSLSAGAPDPSLFEVPTNYTERSPSEAMAERARMLRQSCPTCRTAKETLDKAYASRQTF